jgi:hypothetical protein
MTRDKKSEKKNSREFRRERNQSQQPSSKQAQQQSLFSLFLCFFFLFSYSCVSGKTKILYIAKEEEEEGEDGYNNQCKKKMHNIVSFGSDDLKASSGIFLKICNKIE